MANCDSFSIAHNEASGRWRLSFRADNGYGWVGEWDSSAMLLALANCVENEWGWSGISAEACNQITQASLRSTAKYFED